MWTVLFLLFSFFFSFWRYVSFCPTAYAAILFRASAALSPPLLSFALLCFASQQFALLGRLLLLPLPLTWPFATRRDVPTMTSPPPPPPFLQLLLLSLTSRSNKTDVTFLWRRWWVVIFDFGTQPRRPAPGWHPDRPSNCLCLLVKLIPHLWFIQIRFRCCRVCGRYFVSFSLFLFLFFFFNFRPVQFALFVLSQAYNLLCFFFRWRFGKTEAPSRRHAIRRCCCCFCCCCCCCYCEVHTSNGRHLVSDQLLFIEAYSCFLFFCVLLLLMFCLRPLQTTIKYNCSGPTKSRASRDCCQGSFCSRRAQNSLPWASCPINMKNMHGTKFMGIVLSKFPSFL